MEKRKQASRTPNASRNTTSRSMSERQGVRGLPNLAPAFGVREACFRFALSHASMLFGIGRTGKLESCFCFRFNANGPGGGPVSARSKIEMLPSSKMSQNFTGNFFPIVEGVVSSVVSLTKRKIMAKPIPDGFHTITPNIVVSDAA